MSAAIADVYPYEGLSKEYAVPKSTLNEHLTGKVPEGAW